MPRAGFINNVLSLFRYLIDFFFIFMFQTKNCFIYNFPEQQVSGKIKAREQAHNIA